MKGLLISMLFVFILLSGEKMIAQIVDGMVPISPATERSGCLVNRKGEPVDFATVVVLNGDKQMAAVITDDAGRFSFSIGKGNYRMKIQNIAYQPVDQELHITDETDLGLFTMEDGQINLDAIVVTASIISREADRFIMQVNEHIPTLMNKDAAEVLQLAPGVWVSDDGISINGTGGTKVFINNRELKLESKELVAYLRNYRSSDIARVEVIPQAGAEYSADSKGGVVRILLRKKQDNGMDANVLLQTTQGENYEHYRPSGTLNALSGKWMWNVSATGYITPEQTDEVLENRIYTGQQIPAFLSESSMKGKPRLGMGRLGTIFEINHRNSVGAEVEFGQQKNKIDSYAETIYATDNSTVGSTSDYGQQEKNRNLSVTVDYIHKIDTLGSLFKMIVDYTDKKVTADNDYQSVFHTSYQSMDSVYRNNAHSDYAIYTADAVWEKIFRKGMKFTSGSRYTHNRVSNRTFYESRLDDQWKPLENYNYSLDYTENIGALYSTFSTQVGALGVQAGLRGEYTRTTGKGNVDKNYFDLFPSVNLTYSFDPMRTFMLVGQYSRHIQRPNFWHLNTNRVQYSDYAYMIGNPQLRPTYVNSMSLTAVYKYRYTLTIGGNLHKDLIREVTKVDPSDPEVKYIIPENHHMENHYFVAVSCPLNIAKWFSVQTNLVGVKQDIRGVKSDKLMKHYLYFINSTANITLPSEVYLEFSYDGTSRLYSANSGIEPSHLLHAQVKKKFCGNRINVALGLHNVFNRRSVYFAHMDTYTNSTDMLEARNGRTVKLSLQYNFKSGKTVKKRLIDNRSDAKKERLEKSSGMK